MIKSGILFLTNSNASFPFSAVLTSSPNFFIGNVKATNSLFFRWATVSSGGSGLANVAGPNGEDVDSLYAPKVVSIPSGATSVKINCSARWNDSGEWPFVDADGYVGSGRDESLIYNRTNKNYVTSTYRSQNIERAFHYDGELVGFWSNGDSGTGSIGTTITITATPR